MDAGWSILGAGLQPEALLTAQAHTLGALFNHLTRLAYGNWNNVDAAERLLRLAFKAQTQSRATVETLGALRNPPVVFARQANIAHGAQQVNNDSCTSTRAHAHAGEMRSEPSKPLETKEHHEDNPLLRTKESRYEVAVSSDRDELTGAVKPCI